MRHSFRTSSLPPQTVSKQKQVHPHPQTESTVICCSHYQLHVWDVTSSSSSSAPSLMTSPCCHLSLPQEDDKSRDYYKLTLLAQIVSQMMKSSTFVRIPIIPRKLTQTLQIPPALNAFLFVKSLHFNGLGQRRNQSERNSCNGAHTFKSSSILD